MRRTPNRDRGFTLIELMIVVVVIGILAAIAYPSYQNYVLRSHRADAQAEMMNLAQAMERCYTINNTYNPTGGCVTLPPAGRYAFAFVPNPPAANSYEIRATPQGSQANDACGMLTLNHRGIKTPTANRCWN